MTLTYPVDARLGRSSTGRARRTDRRIRKRQTTPSPERRTAPPWNSCGASARASGLAEDPVEVRAADGADALGHLGALVVDANLALSLALLLALHAVELAAPGLRHDGLLACSMSRSSRRG